MAIPSCAVAPRVPFPTVESRAFSEGRFTFQPSVQAGSAPCLRSIGLRIGSVPRSVQDPLTSSAVNVEGTLNVLLAARDEGVRRVVFSSSSSVYGAKSERPVDESLSVADVDEPSLNVPVAVTVLVTVPLGVSVGVYVAVPPAAIVTVLFCSW